MTSYPSDLAHNVLTSTNHECLAIATSIMGMITHNFHLSFRTCYKIFFKIFDYKSSSIAAAIRLLVPQTYLIEILSISSLRTFLLVFPTVFLQHHLQNHIGEARLSSNFLL